MGLEERLKTIWFTPSSNGWGIPWIFVGDPGISKTARLKSLSKKCGLVMERLSPGARGDAAFGVVPVPENGFLEEPPHAWTKKFLGDAAGMVFVDEINTAKAHSTQAALFDLIHERRNGSAYLGSRVRVVGAMNPVDKNGLRDELDCAVVNRGGMSQWPFPGPRDWVDWLTGVTAAADEDGQLDPRLEEERVLTAWPAAWARASGVVGGFVLARPELMHTKPPDGSPKASQPWSSLRTLEYATRILAGAEIHRLSTVDTDELVAGLVGDAVAGELNTYRENADLPDLEQFLDGKVKFTHSVTRLDRTRAVLVGCSALVAPKTAAKRQERAAALWTFLETVQQDAAELVVDTGIALTKASLHTLPQARAVKARLWGVMENAGMKA